MIKILQGSAVIDSVQGKSLIHLLVANLLQCTSAKRLRKLVDTNQSYKQRQSTPVLLRYSVEKMYRVETTCEIMT